MRDDDRERALDALDALGPLRGVREVPANNTLTAPSGVVYRGLYVGGTGDVVVETEEGQTVTLVGLAAGLWHGVFFRRIVSATATSLLVGR